MHFKTARSSALNNVNAPPFLQFHQLSLKTGEARRNVMTSGKQKIEASCTIVPACKQHQDKSNTAQSNL